MIQILGKLIQQSDIFESGSMESVILKRMQEAKVVYSYEAFDELLFELKLRKHIIHSAIEMSKSKAKFNVFSNARGNPQFWVLTQRGVIHMKSGIKPADAIRDIFINSSLYTFECATATVIIYYYAILKMIGETQFNKYFPNLTLYSWHLDSNFPIYTFFGNHLLPGDVVYFNNPDYDSKTPWWRGQNAVELGDGTYFGHGFGIRNAEEMIEFFNKKRKPGSQTSAYLTSLITRPVFRELEKIAWSKRFDEFFNMQTMVILHNKCSISHPQYLSYFNHLR